jgi:hypothetical protein
MTKTYFSALLFFTLALTSCDPAHNINFINDGESAVKVKLIVNPKTNYQRLNEIKEGDSIVIQLKPVKTEENIDGIYFGIGVWDETEIKNVAECLKRIEIENTDYKVIYKSQESIQKLLLENQEGFWWKTEINISVYDDLSN